MKKVFHIQFYSDAIEGVLQNLALMVAKHNGEKVTLDLNTLAGYFKGYCAQYGYDGEAITHEDTLCLKIKGNPFINITEHLLIGSIDENNNVVKNENY